MKIVSTMNKRYELMQRIKKRETLTFSMFQLVFKTGVMNLMLQRGTPYHSL